jgi:hypothetical protein
MITHIYTLNTTNQLVDINDTYTSFTTMYSVTCDNLESVFEYAITSQKMLDNNEVHFKKAVGHIEDSVTRNTKSFENWYLILRANENIPCKVMLEITSLDQISSPPASPSSSQIGRRQLSQESDELPRRRRPPPPPPPPLKRRVPPPPPPQYNSDTDSDDDYVEEFVQPPAPREWWWYAFLFLAIVVITIGALWWFGKLHLLPFYNYFVHRSQAPVTSASTRISPVPIAPPPPPPPPLEQSHPPEDVIKLPEPEIFVPPPPPQAPQPLLDPNFVNEMRELKLNF